MDWREADGVRWLEAALPGASAAFTTRVGGASSPPFASLNLGLLTGDDRAAVLANRDRALRRLGRDPAGVLSGHQVHGAELQRREAPPDPNPWREPTPGLAEADAQATSAPALTPAVLVADCLPVALAGPRGIAMLHCGWRGLAAGIVRSGVEEVGATSAAIGPGIGPCCYEVGEEVMAAFGGLGEDVADGRMLDLTEVARRLLADAGVTAVDAAGLCTSCEEDLFFSHRRDGERTGRQGGFAWLEA
jgi:purine-nucleoside/S-methyl-5'-thioadenosine phosphorylase / adenosine deaminase